MSTDKSSTRTPYVHPDDPANHLKPGEAFVVDGLDWSWAFVIHRDVPGFPGYCVGSEGSIWTAWKRVGRNLGGTFVTTVSDRWKRMAYSGEGVYHQVGLRRDGKAYGRKVHTLVAEAFYGPCPPGMQCCHYDDEKSNNRITNLRWDTCKANKADMTRNGRWRTARGERAGMAKLTADQVRLIREIYAEGGTTYRELGRQFGVHPSSIDGIVLRRSWAHVS